MAGIVAASNAGGAGSVVGDTTTTMMWISGIPPLEVFEAYVAAGLAVAISGFVAAQQQQAYQPIQREETAGVTVDGVRVGIVVLILALAMGVNIVVNTRYVAISDAFPFIGVAVWAAILIGAPLRATDWSVLPGALRGAAFLLSLVLCASLMPVSELPAASWQTAFGLGFLSAVFDNIPLTALAIKQGGYDWGFLAYAVGFGGSMIWFGSSAGVALTSMFPAGRSVGRWVTSGWHVALGYVLGFALMLTVLGFHPGTTPRNAAPVAAPASPR
jgi:hypothetical protein